MSNKELLEFLKKSGQALDLAFNKAVKQETVDEAKTVLVEKFRIELMKKLFRPGESKY